ncbi:MAG: biotin/lipoyl-binding protein [Deltaproteobacteria bacterium]|nr:MAG: biotin/lipoyl-binding protein [Deltaproteobacteria bacterium]
MQRELCATVVGSDPPIEVAIRVEPIDGDRWRVEIDGRVHEADARQVRPGTWSLLVDGRSWLVDIDERRRGTVVAVAGSETTVAVEDARRKRLAEVARRDGGGADGRSVVAAPIAGKVVKVLVEPGKRVAEGDGLVVLEAMKMENEIRAPRAGVVEAVHVDAGRSVETQEPLVTLGPGAD